MAFAGASQQKIGEIRAGDQQYQSDGAHQNQQWIVELRAPTVESFAGILKLVDGSRVGPVFGKRVLDGATGRIETRAGFGHRDSRLEAREHAEPNYVGRLALIASQIRGQGGGNP